MQHQSKIEMHLFLPPSFSLDEGDEVRMTLASFVAHCRPLYAQRGWPEPWMETDYMRRSTLHLAAAPRTPLIAAELTGMLAHWFVSNDIDAADARELLRACVLYETEPGGVRCMHISFGKMCANAASAYKRLKKEAQQA